MEHYMVPFWSPTGAAYVRRWTASALVQVMACHLFGTKPLPEPILTYCQLDPEEQTSVKIESKYKISTEENAFENVVCKMEAILSRADDLIERLFFRVWRFPLYKDKIVVNHLTSLMGIHTCS